MPSPTDRCVEGILFSGCALVSACLRKSQLKKSLTSICHLYITANLVVRFQELYYFGCLLLLFLNFVLQTIVAGRVLPSVEPKKLDRILLIIYGSCVLVFHAFFGFRIYNGVRVEISS